MNIRDQRTKITVIQEQGLPLRGGSVIPDLSAPRYQIPRPPPPPLFSDSPQAQLRTRKRSSDAAFGGDASSIHWARVPPNQRPRPAMAGVDHEEYSLVPSVEYDMPEESHQALGHRGEASVDLTKDGQLPSARRAANVGYEIGGSRSLADVKPSLGLPIRKFLCSISSKLRGLAQRFLTPPLQPFKTCPKQLPSAGPMNKATFFGRATMIEHKGKYRLLFLMRRSLLLVGKLSCLLHHQPRKNCNLVRTRTHSHRTKLNQRHGTIDLIHLSHRQQMLR
jgi:hypothetical protein